MTYRSYCNVNLFLEDIPSIFLVVSENKCIFIFKFMNKISNWKLEEKKKLNGVEGILRACLDEESFK